MIHLFIDTNRYLLLYGFSNEDLDKIKKLAQLIKDKKITLWLPEQVKIEFYRNREKIPLQKCEQIKKALSEYKIPKLPEIPEFEADLKELHKYFEEIKKIEEKINRKIDGTIQSVKEKLKKESFIADKIIEELFSLAKLIKYDDEIIKKARTRFDLDIPPGKKGSYGDAVIWETLLKEFPEKEQLYFVGFDNDFRSIIDENDFSPFLLKEWKNAKKADIKPYKHLGEFTKDKIPEIEQSDKIIDEEKRVDKNFLITATAFSEAFKEISKSTYAWKEIADSMNAYRNTIAHAIATVNIPKDVMRQQAELARQYTEAINNTLKNIKMPSSVFAEALRAYEPFRKSVAEDAIKKAIEESKEEEKMEENSDKKE